VAISADGEYIVAGTLDGRVYLFDKDSSTPLWNYTTEEQVHTVAISADGEYIVAGSYDDKIYLFNKYNNTPLWSYDTGGNIYSIAISADGEYIAAGSGDDKVYLFDKDSSTPIWSYETGHNVRSVSISADGEHIAAGSSDDNVYLFDKDSSTPIWSYTTTSDNLDSLAISADGEYITAGTAGSDDKVYLFRNDPVSRPSVIPYGPRSGSVVLSNTTLRWFPGSDDIANLTFDVYLDTSPSNSTKIADNITDYHYTVSNLSEDATYYWKIVATDNTGTATSQVMHFTVADTTPPLVNITSGPDAVTRETTAIFYFTSNEDDSTFECALDGSDWSSCYSGGNSTSYSGLGLGGHTFAVKATDASDNTGEPAYWDWTIRSQYVVYIEDNGYNSSYIEIVLGYAVTWVNNDDTLHTVTADDDLFDSGSLGPGDEWSYYFNDMGTYDYHCDYHDSMNGTVFVGEQPNESPVVWNITIDPNPAYEDERVYFDSDWEDSDGYVTVFEWTSNVDGLLSTNDSFNSDELSIGNHTISFRVQDDDGAWSESAIAELVIFSSNTPPVAMIDFVSPSPIKEGMSVSFLGSGTDSDGTVTGYEWTSDVDGLLSTNDSFDSDELSIGNHTISFRVQDNDGGWSNWDTTTLVIHPNTPPVAMIDFVSPSPVKEGMSVSFLGSGTDSDGTVTGYEWISSLDGTLGNEKDFNGAGLSTGTHTISFRVQDDDGEWSNWDTATLVIHPHPAPVADAGPDLKATPGSQATFFGSAVDADGHIVLYEWDFDGDGVFDFSSSDNFSSHVYDEEGSYLVILRVTDNDGLTDTDTVKITISEEKVQIDDEGNVTVTDTKEDEEGIPALSVITTMAAVAVITLRRSRKP
jgi:plastocyanin/outer membrane protein assembly factor BamB